jgi:hypothetical protein
MTCGKCGAHDQNDAFCSKCGSVIDHTTTICSSCLKEVLNSYFCHLCGESLGARVCVHCGAANQTGRFCRSCGMSSAEKRAKETKETVATGACPSCGESRWSTALRTNKWVVCLACFEQFDRIVMVDDECPSCGGRDIYQKSGGDGPYCAHCIQPQAANS